MLQVAASHPASFAPAAAASLAIFVNHRGVHLKQKPENPNHNDNYNDDDPDDASERRGALHYGSIRGAATFLANNNCNTRNAPAPTTLYENDVFIYGPFGILTGSCYGQ